MFGSKFWYNKNVSPDNPGIINFSIWFIKTGFFVAITTIFIVSIIPEKSQAIISISIVLFLPMLEEHGRIVFSINSVNKYFYSLKFGLLLFLGELITESINDWHISVQSILHRLEYKYQAIFTHIALSLVLISLYKIKEDGYVTSIYTVWLISSLIHILLNAAISFMHTGAFFIV